MREYAKGAQGYVYVVSVLGTTGERAKIASDAAKTVDRAREAFDLPVALGFGLKRPGQLQALPPESQPDAAVFGSALLSWLDNGGKAADFMKAWRQ